MTFTRPSIRNWGIRVCIKLICTLSTILASVRQTINWARMTRALSRDGAYAWTSVHIYMQVVQLVILYGLETWVLIPRMKRVLGGFHHRVACKLMGRQPRIGQDGVWVYPPLEDMMVDAVFHKGGDLRLLTPEHSRTVYFVQSHYVPVSGWLVESAIKGSQSVVVAGWTRFVGDADRGSGGGTVRGGWGDGRYGDGDRDGLNWW